MPLGTWLLAIKLLTFDLTESQRACGMSVLSAPVFLQAQRARTQALYPIKAIFKDFFSIVFLINST